MLPVLREHAIRMYERASDYGLKTGALLTAALLVSPEPGIAQEAPDEEQLSDWARMVRDAGPEALPTDLGHLSFLDRVQAAFQAVSGGFWVGLAMLLLDAWYRVGEVPHPPVAETIELLAERIGSSTPSSRAPRA